MNRCGAILFEFSSCIVFAISPRLQVLTRIMFSYINSHFINHFVFFVILNFALLALVESGSSYSVVPVLEKQLNSLNSVGTGSILVAFTTQAVL